MLLLGWALTGLLLALLLTGLSLLTLLLEGLLLMLLFSGARTGLLLRLGVRLLPTLLLGLTLGLLVRLLLGLMLMLLLMLLLGLRLWLRLRLLLGLLDLLGGSSKRGCLSSILSDFSSVSIPLIRSSPFSLGGARSACSSSSIVSSFFRLFVIASCSTKGDRFPTDNLEKLLDFRAERRAFAPSSSELLSLVLSVSVPLVLSEVRFDLRFDLLSRRRRLLSRRLSLLRLPRLCLSLLEDFFLRLRLSSLEELREDEDESESESLS